MSATMHKFMKERSVVAFTVHKSFGFRHIHIVPPNIVIRPVLIVPDLRTVWHLLYDFFTGFNRIIVSFYNRRKFFFRYSFALSDVEYIVIPEEWNYFCLLCNCVFPFKLFPKNNLM